MVIYGSSLPIAGKRQTVQSILVGTQAQSANPWPGTSERQGILTACLSNRMNRLSPCIVRPASVPDASSFLRMETPKPVQVGVVVKRGITSAVVISTRRSAG